MKRLAPLLSAPLLLAGCASTNPAKPRGDVNDMLSERAGIDDAFAEEQDTSGEEVRRKVAELLAKPLDSRRAVQIALLNNRGFQATLEDLGVAQADLVQAGLLSNPTIGGDIIVSTKGFGIGGGASFSQSLLSVFLVPAKKRIAKAELQHAIMVVSHEALALVRDTTVAYAEFEAARAGAKFHRQMVQAAEVANDLAQRQDDAGNIAPRERALIAAGLDEARLELLDAELELTMAREQINRLLGLWGDQIEWTAVENRAAIPEGEVKLAALESHGVRERVDLSAARFNVQSVEYALKLRRRGVIPEVEVGVEAGNEVGDDVGHEWVLGPALAIELPLFDPGHADFARLRAQLRQAQHNLAQRAIHARSEIRSDREAYVAAQRRAEYYRDTVTPRHETIYESTLLQYNAMLLGAYELFETRAHQLEALEEQAEAMRDYWTARANLEMSVGGRLPE